MNGEIEYSIIISANPVYGGNSVPKIIAFIIELAILICAIWVISFLSTLFHEVGHALGYRIATGDGHWHIRVGWGKCLLNTKRLTVKLIPFDGLFTPLGKEKMDTAAKLIAMLSGGPAASLLFVAAFLLLKIGGISFLSEVVAPDAIESFINSAFFINLVILVLSLFPTHYFYGETKGFETDGLQIIHAVKNSRSKLKRK